MAQLVSDARYALNLLWRATRVRRTIYNMTVDDSQSNDQLFKEVFSVIELIRPSIRADGGDIELVSVDQDGVVSIRFLGECIGCPSLDMTLQGGIEVMLKNRIDWVTQVQAVG